MPAPKMEPRETKPGSLSETAETAWPDRLHTLTTSLVPLHRSRSPIPRPTPFPGLIRKVTAPSRPLLVLPRDAYLVYEPVDLCLATPAIVQEKPWKKDSRARIPLPIIASMKATS